MIICYSSNRKLNTGNLSDFLYIQIQAHHDKKEGYRHLALHAYSTKNSRLNYDQARPKGSAKLEQEAITWGSAKLHRRSVSPVVGHQGPSRRNRQEGSLSD